MTGHDVTTRAEEGAAAKEAPVTDATKRAVHLILQAKGGVGKSFIPALLTQYLLKREGGAKVLALDTDPANATLFGYQGPARGGPRIDCTERRGSCGRSGLKGTSSR